MTQENGALSIVDPQPPPADFLGDLLGPLAIEGPPTINAEQSQQNIVSGLEGDHAAQAAAIVPVDEAQNSVQVIYRAFVDHW